LLIVSKLLFAESTINNEEIAHKVEVQKNIGDIYLSVSNLPAETTGLIVSIYRSQDTFLKKADQIYHFPIETIKNNELLLKQIVYGEFVIAVTADLNGNKLLDTKLFGIPNEPVGFANNAKSRFGPPRFKDHVVKHDRTQQKFDVSLVKI
jgi:uncharacterized protein (DUF2141 family)